MDIISYIWRNVVPPAFKYGFSIGFVSGLFTALVVVVVAKSM